MKKVIVLGSGAQGTAAARLLNNEENVESIICADYSLKASEAAAEGLEKASAVQINAKSAAELEKLFAGSDIVLNGLPIDFNLTVMEAALKCGVNYQDLCMTEIAGLDAVESTRYMFTEMNAKFAETGCLALTNTGSAPGLANVICRETAEYFDSVNSIEINVYEGVWSKRFIPFWWSPEVAFSDMAEVPIRFEDGRHIFTRQFGNPVMMNFPGVDKEIRMVDHNHEEPITMGLNAEKYLKGAKNILFRYGGPHVEVSETLYNMGLLSKEKRLSGNTEYIPFDLVISQTPQAPKYREEIAEIIEEGLITEEGAFQIIVEGIKSGNPLRKTVYVNTPGLIESFEKAGISHESYLTGQSAFIFTKMLVNDVINASGLIAPEALDADARKFFIVEAAKLGITFDVITEDSL